MKIRFLPVIFLSFSSLQAQYYYNDIIGTMETNRQMKTYLDNKVKLVTATGYDHNGVRSTTFSEAHEVRENGKALKVTSNINRNYGAYYNRFDAQNRLISITDSSTDVQSITTYEYDGAGRIVTVQNSISIRDSASDLNQTEIHRWSYNANGSPQKMWRTINGTSYVTIPNSKD
jgi:YD repeat-containing protein